jgi:hypothetical protein
MKSHVCRLAIHGAVDSEKIGNTKKEKLKWYHIAEPNISYKIVN